MKKKQAKKTAPPQESASASRPSGVRRIALLLGVTVVALALAWGGANAVIWFRERPLDAAEKSLSEGDFEETLKATADFLRDYPDNSRALALRARALVAAGTPQQAIELFDRVGPASADELHALSRAHLMQQHWSQALPLLVRVLQLEPANADALYEITACRVQLGMLSDAISTAEEFSRLPGNEARGHVFLGTIHSDLGNYRDAAKAYAKVLEYEPQAEHLQVSPDEFRLEYSRTLIDVGQPAEAVPLLRKCLQGRPSAEAYLLLGNAQNHLGQTEEAAAAWQKAVELDNTNIAAREALATAEVRANHPREALAWLAPLVAHPDLEASTAYLFQRAHAMQGDDDAAKSWAEKLAALRTREKRDSAISSLMKEAPQSFWARVVRAHRFAEAGNWQQADSLIQALQKEQPSDEFFLALEEAVRKRGPLPSLDGLPIKQF